MNELELDLMQNQSRQPQYLVRQADGMIIDANSVFLQLFGCVQEQFGSLPEAELVERSSLFAAENETDAWVRCRTRQGKVFMMGHTSLELGHREGGFRVVTLWETTLQEKVLNRLRLSEQIFATALDGILVTDNQGIIQYVNPAFMRLTGYAAEELFGMTPRILSSGRHDDAFYRAMWQKLISEGQWTGEVWNRRKNGEIYPEWLAISSMRDPQGNILMYTAMFRDLSERYRYEQQIRHQALHDPLTGLQNRRCFHEKLKAAIAETAEGQSGFALVYLDLDGFKQVNDSLGHEAGDQVLRLTAGRILDCAAHPTDCFRMGGDEFTLLIDNSATPVSRAREIAGCLLREISQPMQIAGQTTAVGASIGIALFPADGRDEEGILTAADHRMYAAKRGGRNRIVCADNEAKET